jgi:carbon storage regulator
MLVLSRKLNETIVIDGGIEITIVRIDRKQIRLAIKAPDEVRILRGELVVPIETAGGITVAEGRPSSA